MEDVIYGDQYRQGNTLHIPVAIPSSDTGYICIDAIYDEVEDTVRWVVLGHAEEKEDIDLPDDFMAGDIENIEYGSGEVLLQFNGLPCTLMVVNGDLLLAPGIMPSQGYTNYVTTVGNYTIVTHFVE